MNCEDLQFNLSLYSDDYLNADERRILDAHLAQCPLCRQKLDDFQFLRNELRGLARPEMPKNLLASVRNKVAAELQAVSPTFEIFPAKSFGEWVRSNLMPSAVAVAASLIICSTLLFSMLSATQPNEQTQLTAVVQRPNPSVLLTSGNSKRETESLELSASEYAQSRLSVAGESPSVNPHGALVAMTKAFVRGKMKDDEVVVVADVLSSGLAQISEVVEPSRDRQAVSELENALKNNPAYAPPFVPSNLDGRSDTVRVIFKIQSVNVSTSLKSKRK